MISVLIPAYNEADRIGATVQAVRTIPALHEIIVIDDGSTDVTGLEAEKAGADTVLRQPHRGKGAALNTGFALATGDIFLLLDADLGATAGEGRKLIEPLRRGGADMTIALLTGGKGGGFGFVVGLARKGIFRLTGREMQAPLSGQRAVRRNVIEASGGFAEGWGAEVALTVTALRAGFRVLEVQTEMTHRVTGRSPAAMRHRFAQYRAVRRVLKELEAPEKTGATNPPGER